MRLLAFQHTPGEHPAAFADHAKATGDPVTAVRLYADEPIPDLAEFDALLVMGGPMDVWDVTVHPWLIPEKAAIASWIDAGRPFLGVCLGHQLMVEALGGRCAKLDVPEISVSPITRIAPDQILDQLPQSFPVMKWHGVAADVLPEDTTVLAESTACKVQAIRYRDHAWGVQFHPEITASVIPDWMEDPANKACAIDWLGSAAAAAKFAADSAKHVPNAMAQSAALYAGLRAASAPH